MYCMQCGCQIPNTARFCPSCGKQNSIVQTKTPNNRQFNNTYFQKLPNNNFLIKHQYNKYVFENTIIKAVIIFILIIVGMVCLLTIDNWSVFKDDRGKVEFVSNKTDITAGALRLFLKISLAVEAGINFIVFILRILKASSIKNTYICIINSGIYGIGGTDSYILNKEFKLNYTEIISISVKARCIIIKSSTGVFKLFIDNYLQAVNEISKGVENVSMYR